MPENRPDGHVRSLHRYPVKSLAGEALDETAVDVRGLRADRAWAVRDADGKLGSGKSTRRFRRMRGLLDLTARLADDGVPVVRMPDGRRLRADDPGVHAALSAHVGRPVTLARESDVSHFDDGPVHLLTTSTLHAVEAVHGRPLDPRRFRPNLVLDTDAEGYVEDDWIGRDLALGDEVVLRVTALMPRCVMVNLAQCGGVPADGGVLQAATDAHAGSVGVVAVVARPGRVAVGDPVRALG